MAGAQRLTEGAPQLALRETKRNEPWDWTTKPETDAFYIELKDAPGAETREIGEGVLADFDANGNVVGFDIVGASGKLDRTRVETIALPPAPAAE